ncbi:oligosaccharide flippase family protein [Lachnospiraceae bacterium 62-35]
MKKLIDYYKKLSLPLKVAMWLTLCQFLQKAIGLITTPFFTRILSTAEYGIISTYMSWENIFLILVSLSVSHAIMNLNVKYDNRDMILSSIVGLSLLMASIWAGIFLIFRDNLVTFSGLSGIMIVFLFVYCLFQNIILSWMTKEQYDYAHKRVIFVTIVYTAVTSFSGLYLVTFVSQTAKAKIFPEVCMVSIIGIILIIHIFFKGKVFFHKKIWTFALTFCVPLLPHYISEIILQSSDRIMINRLCSTSDVAIYSIAYSVGNLIVMVTSAVNAVFVPYQYKKIKSKEYKVLAKNSEYIITFVGICLCGIMFFGKEIVQLFGGTKYLESITLIAPICLGAFFNYVFQLFARIQEYFEQKYTIVIASVSCAALNIILNYIFIGLFGYKAAAYTTFTCYFIFCFLHYLFYKMVCKKYIGYEIYNAKSLVIISIVLIVLTILIQFLTLHYLIKYIVLAVVLMMVFVLRKKIFTFIINIKDI